MNLIQDRYDTLNYFCTWSTQCSVQISGRSSGRDSLCEDLVFGKDGMVHLYPSIRRHLWLVLDDGWDVPYGMTGDDNYRHGRFGSLIVDGERFPSCTGTPAERLAQLSRRVKEHGWRGLGLWICANACGEYWGHFQTPEEQEHYWRERLRWCREAGIGYWKVDWGHHDRSAAFRRRLSVWAAEEAPALVVEHSGVVAPFSGIEDHDDSTEHSGRFADWRDEPMRCAELMRFSQVYRTYDVSAELSVPTTLDRVQFPLRMAEFTGSPTVLNCEDEPLIGAVLGCAIGIMRSSLPAFGMSPYCRTAEVIRAIRWQTAFAPAFAPTAEAPTRISTDILWESFDFRHSGPWLAGYGSRVTRQGAPRLCARGGELPQVVYPGEETWVISGRHPNGAVSAAVLPRFGAEGRRSPAAQITLKASVHTPVGLFGAIDSATLRFDESLTGKHIYAQDLAADTAVEITDRVTAEGCNLSVDGALLRELCAPLQTKNDDSAPGVVLVVR